MNDNIGKVNVNVTNIVVSSQPLCLLLLFHSRNGTVILINPQS